MVGLRFTLALALLLLCYTPSCLGQEEGQDPGPQGQGPQGPPPDSSVRNVRRQEETGEAPQGQGPLHVLEEIRSLGSFLHSNEASLKERDESLQERDYGVGASKTRNGKTCTDNGRKFHGNDKCKFYTGSTSLFFQPYLWCYTTEDNDEWESCCYHSCTYYRSPWSSFAYHYCYVNKDETAWDYCNPDAVNTK